MSLSADERMLDAGFKPLPIRQMNPPSRWAGDGFVLRVAAPEWAALDLEAVRVSRECLRGLFGPDDPWPPDTLDLEGDRADLRWHADEFQSGRSFAYLILNEAQNRCLGCLYIYPTRSPDHDAEGYLWTRSDLPPAQAVPIEREVIRWVVERLSLRRTAWPGRAIGFDAWNPGGAGSYYTVMR